MKLCKITKENAEEFAAFTDEALLKDDPVIGAGCLDDDENPIGAAFLDSDGERLIITSIFVDEGSRRKGAGSLMIEGILEMSEIAETSSVEAYFSGEDAESFYIKNGFLVAESVPMYRIKVGDISGLRSFDKFIKKDGNTVSLKDLNRLSRQKFNKAMGEMGYLSRPDQYDPDFSFVYSDKEGNPKAFILTKVLKDEGIIRVEQLMNTDGDHPENAASVLISGLNALKEAEFSSNTIIEFISIDDRIFEFASRISGGEENVIRCGSLLHAIKLT